MFPLVIYNGEPRWQAPLDIAELIEPVPGDLARYRPHLRYLLLDEGRYPNLELAPMENLVAALFRMENSRAPQELQQVLQPLLGGLRAPAQASLRRAFAVWLKRVLLPARMPGVDLPETAELNEVNRMLAERVKEWTRQWKAEGWQEGLQQRLQQGEVMMLLRLLEHKFGPLEDEIRARLQTADLEQLLRWAERALTAETLPEVFQ